VFHSHCKVDKIFELEYFCTDFYKTLLAVTRMMLSLMLTIVNFVCPFRIISV
jgi:hypothetical protein